MSSAYFDPTVGGNGTTVTDDKDPTTGLDAGGYITRFVPALAQVVAVAQFVVSTATGLSNGVWTPCRLATTANDTLSGLAARDGVTPVAGDRVLVAFQTAASANGIYIAASGAWTRATDASIAANFAPGKIVGVGPAGATLGGSVWVLGTAAPITVGTTSLTFNSLPSKLLANIWTAAQTFNGSAAFNGATTFNAAAAFNAAINMTGAPINEALAANIASAGTINLEAATGSIIDITGTSAISAITLSAGHERKVRFTGVLTITPGASLLLPAGVPLTTAANDTAVIRGYAGGVVQIVQYTRSSGLAVAGTSGRLLRVTYIAGSGSTGVTTTFAKGADAATIIVKLCASGGGGGGCTATGGAAASGGGGGGYGEFMCDASAIAASETVTLSNGGPGGNTSGSNGSNGGTSSFSTGPVKIINMVGGLGGGGATASSTLNAPGSGGYLVLAGTAWKTIMSAFGGDGGVGVSTSSASTAIGGFGGSSMGSGSVAPSISTGTGSAGNLGGGGAGAKGATASVGGAGGAGWMTIEEYS